MQNKTRTFKFFISKYLTLANFSSKAVKQMPKKLGLIGMRGVRRTVNKDFEVNYNEEKANSKEKHTLRPDQTLSLKPKEVLIEEYNELAHEFENMINYQNNDNLYKSKKMLEDLFFKVKEKGFLKSELTCCIIEVLAETNQKLRLYSEADINFLKFLDSKNYI